MMEESNEYDTKESDPSSGMNKDQLKRIAHEGKGDHIHKLMDGSFTSGAIILEDRPGHVHTYQTESGEDKRTSISEGDNDKHTHETEKGTTGLPE